MMCNMSLWPAAASHSNYSIDVAAARGRSRFTLIEMLVVVAIIAILASLMSPSLMKTLESARAVSCLNNLRQCGLALGAYADDYQGWIPGSQVYAKNGIPWTGMLTDVSPRAHAPLAGNYIGDPKAFFCPSAAYPEGGYRGNQPWDNWRWTYGMNGVVDYGGKTVKWQGQGVWRWTAYLDPNGASRWIRLHSVQTPGKKPLVGDTVNNDPGNPEAFAAKQQICEWLSSGHYNGQSLHARHQERVNLWFADGHLAPTSGPDLGEKYEVKCCSMPSGEIIDWF